MKYTLAALLAAVFLSGCLSSPVAPTMPLEVQVTPSKAGTSIRLSNLRAEVRDGVLDVSAQVGGSPGWRSACFIDDGEPGGYFARWDAEIDVVPWQGWKLLHWNITNQFFSDILADAIVTATPHSIHYQAPLSGLAESGTLIVAIGYFGLPDDWTQITCSYGTKHTGPPASLPDPEEMR